MLHFWNETTFFKLKFNCFKKNSIKGVKLRWKRKKAICTRATQIFQFLPKPINNITSNHGFLPYHRQFFVVTNKSYFSTSTCILTTQSTKKGIKDLPELEKKATFASQISREMRDVLQKFFKNQNFVNEWYTLCKYSFRNRSKFLENVRTWIN